MPMTERVQAVRAAIAAAALEAGRRPADILLVAATKDQPADRVRRAIAAGITACGENRVQEMDGKLEQYAYDGAALHFIGHLQSNKVRQVVGRVELIESIDSRRLLQAVDRQAERLGVVQDVLLEVNIAGEESKHGLTPEETVSLALASDRFRHVRVRGLMCIPPIPQHPGQNRAFFAAVRKLSVDIRNKIRDNSSDMDCLSMGMSGDFEDAVREGATIVRLGAAIFGPRPSRREKDGPDAKENEGVSGNGIYR